MKHTFNKNTINNDFDRELIIKMIVNSQIKQQTLGVLFNSLLKNNPIPSFCKDINGKYLFINDAYLKYRKITKDKVIGFTDDDFNKEGYLKRIHKNDQFIFKNKKIHSSIQEITEINGDESVYEVVKIPIFNDKKEFVSFVGFLNNITIQTQLERDIIQKNTFDSLTGAYNRLYLTTKLKELDENKYYPLSVVSIDIDGLKMLNDSFGHEIGDKLLKEATTTVINSLSENMFFGRNGGDEFMIIARNTKPDSLFELVSCIKKEFNEKQFSGINGSFSFGISTKVNKSKSIDTLLNEADSNMYKQKNESKFQYRKNMIENMLSSFYNTYKREKSIMEKTRHYAVLIAKEVGLKKSEVDFIRELSYYYLIGRIGVKCDRPLAELGKYETIEYKQHSIKGFSILSISPNHSIYAQYVGLFLEYYNGNGYPNGMKGDRIPMFSKILLIADKISGNLENGMTYVKDGYLLDEYSGIYFDPVLVPIAKRILAKEKIS